MACFSGKDGVVQVNGAAIAQVRSWTLNESAETLDCSHMGNNGWRSFQAGMNTWEGSVDIMWDEQDMVADLAVGGTVTLTLYPNPANYASPTISDHRMSGSVVIVGMEITASYDGLIEATLNFQGTDALTRATA